MSLLKTRFILIVGCACILSALLAEEVAQDVSADLARAKSAWVEANALAQKAHAAVAGGGGDYVKLLDQQAVLYDKAEQLFRDILRKAPENPAALSEFGLFWIDRKQPGQARSLLASAMRSFKYQQNKSITEKKALSPEMTLAPAREALIRRTLGGLMERAGENGPALQNYREAYRLDGSDPRNRLSLAIGLCAAGQAHEAITLLKPWAEEAPKEKASDQPDAAPEILSLGLYTLALADEENGFLEDALQLYRRAAALAEKAGAADNAAVAERAGMAIARLEDTFDAVQVHVKARAAENEERKAKNQPPLPESDERAAYAHAAQQCDTGLSYKEEALDDESFRKALVLARSGAGIERAQNSDTEGADNDALAKNPSFDRFQAAMRSFQEAIVKFPHMARPYFELAACEVMLGRYSTAKKLLDEGAPYSPNNLAMLNLHAEVLLQLGQWEESAKAFTKILMLEPESGRANFGLARAYAALQVDAKQCQVGLDALDRAEQLGVREIRMPRAPGAEPPPPSLREQLTAALQRFERGEIAAPRPTLKGTTPGRQKPTRGPALPGDWKDVFGR